MKRWAENGKQSAVKRTARRRRQSARGAAWSNALSTAACTSAGGVVLPYYLSIERADRRPSSTPGLRNSPHQQRSNSSTTGRTSRPVQLPGRNWFLLKSLSPLLSRWLNWCGRRCGADGARGAGIKPDCSLVATTVLNLFYF